MAAEVISYIEAMRVSLVIVMVLGTMQLGCMAWLGMPALSSGVVGTTSLGAVKGGARLLPNGSSYRLYHRPERAFGTPTLVAAVVRAAEKVACEYPETELAVGDMSAETGGRISGHRSHRGGRDVDFAYFATDLFGDPVSPTPLVRFDRFGVGVRDDEVLLFDAARNWTLVESLLEDEDADVQWIFVSRGIKALLLEWGIDHARDIRTVERAVDVLKQPGDSAPHDDHCHVRIFCPQNGEGTYCVDTGPVWPWVEARRASARDRLSTDEWLVEAALDGL